MKKTLHFQSIHDSVADYIRERIQEGLYRPGDKINEKEFCEILGVSRTPIREALIKLEKEGLVEIRPRRSVRIKILTPLEIKNIYEVVGLLEAEAALEAADKLKESDFQKMEALFNKSKKAVEKGDMRGYLKLNFDLHDVHLALCENTILLDILYTLKKRLHDFPRKLEKTPSWVNHSMKDHVRLIEAFRKRDKKQIHLILRNEHWGKARDYHYAMDQEA